MKKIGKRFLALVVIATMAFSNNFMCFATELDESSVVSDFDAYVDVVDCNVCSDFISTGNVVDLVIDTDGTAHLAEPRATTTFLYASKENESSTTTWSNDFYTDRTGRLHIVLNISGSCHINVKLRKNGSIFTSNFVNETVSNQLAHFYSNGTIEGGSYVKVTLSSFSGGATWVLQAFGET